MQAIYAEWGEFSPFIQSYREVGDAVVHILGVLCAFTAAAMVANAPFSTVRLRAASLRGNLRRNLQVLHNAFNVPLHGRAP